MFSRRPYSHVGAHATGEFGLQPNVFYGFDFLGVAPGYGEYGLRPTAGCNRFTSRQSDGQSMRIGPSMEQIPQRQPAQTYPLSPSRRGTGVRAFGRGSLLVNLRFVVGENSPFRGRLPFAVVRRPRAFRP